MKDNRPLIIALDYSDAREALKLLDLLDPSMCRVKIGKEMFTRFGPELVKQISKQGFEIFLDLKFHDIPNTVAGAVSAAVDLGVWMVNVHATGGRTMMEAAAKAVGTTRSTKLIAVTVLTSMSSQDLNETGVTGAADEQVLRLARLTAESGLDGVVCSAREIEVLRQNFGSEFLLVTPGIRPAGDSAGDQKRTETPATAIAKGSSYLVIGRPITQAANPAEKLREIQLEIHGKI
ncbi:MAG: orotidine-5'-phosphate decarboxylase [Pseudomonadota bacterium]